jgi:hypothetical protein
MYCPSATPDSRSFLSDNHKTTQSNLIECLIQQELDIDILCVQDVLHIAGTVVSSCDLHDRSYHSTSHRKVVRGWYTSIVLIPALQHHLDPERVKSMTVKP